MLAHSGTTGGDGSAILLDTRSAAFFDVGHNPNTERFGIVANETADTTLPVLTGRAIINYSTGFLQFESNETIDSTPSSLIQLENFQLLDMENNVILDGFVGSSVTAYDTVNVSLVLTEYQRAYAQIFSGSTGGIGNALTLKLLDEAFRDVAQNSILETQIPLLEYDDVIPPSVESVSVNYSTGVLSIFMSEIIKNTSSSYLDLSKMFVDGTLGNHIFSLSSSDTRKFSALGITTQAATTRVEISKQVDITLTEHQRVQALYNSSMVTNGDGSGVLFSRSRRNT